MKNEGQKVLCRMSDFEWASAARYMVWLEVNAGVKQVNYDRVYSFRIEGGGIAGLLASKKRLLSEAKGNMAAIEAFAGEHRESLRSEELVVLRSLYCTCKAAIGTLNEQLQRAEAMNGAQKEGLFGKEEEQENDTPF